MQVVWNNKFMTANIIALAIVKLAVAYPAASFLALVSGNILFSGPEIVASTNTFRQELGIVELSLNPALTKAAEEKLNDMLANQYFAHISPSGTDPWYWIKRSGYKYSLAGENLAIGFYDASSTVGAWADSPSHRKNMANPQYKEIGVAVANSTIKGFQGMVIVQLFGSPSAPLKSEIIAKAKPTLLPTVLPPKAVPTVPVLSPPPKESESQNRGSSISRPNQNDLGEIGIQKENPITLAYVNSGPNQLAGESTSSPIITHPNGHATVQSLNNIFMLYATIIAGISFILLISSSVRNELWLKTFIHLAILVSAIYFSPILLTKTAFIF